MVSRDEDNLAPWLDYDLRDLIFELFGNMLGIFRLIIKSQSQTDLYMCGRSTVVLGKALCRQTQAEELGQRSELQWC